MIGIQRMLDNVGRICIPTEYRKYLNIQSGDMCEIMLTDDGKLYIKPVKNEGGDDIGKTIQTSE